MLGLVLDEPALVSQPVAKGDRPAKIPARAFWSAFTSPMRSRMRSRSASANAAAIVKNSLLIPIAGNVAAQVEQMQPHAPRLRPEVTIVASAACAERDQVVDLEVGVRSARQAIFGHDVIVAFARPMAKLARA